jgi:multicomponent Na+:H+ antiporter subunit F
MNVWLVTALVVLVAMLPLIAAALRRPAVRGLPALQVAGVNTSLAFAMLAIGIGRRLFIDLALICGLLGFAGTVAFAAALERRR